MMASTLGKRSASAMSPCPTFDFDAAKAFLDSQPGFDINVCRSAEVGGKKRRNRNKVMRGGMRLTARVIKYGLYVLLALLVGLGLGSSNTKFIVNGLTMLIYGECTHVASRLWGVLGLQNPVCVAFNTFIDTVIKSLYEGNRDALARLLGQLLLLAGTPIALDATITFIADAATRQVAAVYPTLVDIPSTVPRIADVPPEGRAAVAAAEGLTARELSLAERVHSALQAERGGPPDPDADADLDEEPSAAARGGPAGGRRMGGKRSKRMSKRMGKRSKKMYGGKKRRSTRRRRTRRY